MLRENNIPIKDAYFIFQSELEGILEQLTNHSTFSLKAHTDTHNDYALIVSQQTPFLQINQHIRKCTGYIPYLEVAEVNYCSHLAHGATLLVDSCRDAAHTLVAMGLTPESVGLEITEMPDLKPDQVFSKMTPKLASQLLDGELTQENVKHFFDDTFFMPAYLKYDEGILGIKFALLLTDKAVRDKQNTVVWVNEIAFDVYAPDFQQMLRDKGFSSFVVYGSDGVRKETKIENASGNKKFQIVCRRVEKQDFDLLYYLARYTGGVAGCVGQNSFETAVSNDLLPAFYAPPWQLAIIYQCQSLVSSLFNQDSEEYRCLNDYLEMLSKISLFIQAKQAILSMPEVKPYSQSLQLLEGNDFVNALAHIVSDINSLMSRFPDAFQAHPLQQLEAFPQTHDINLLMAAWRQVCTYIKEHKNYNRWLVDQVNQYLANYPAIDMQTNKNTATLSLKDTLSQLDIYHYVLLENLPNTTELIRETFSIVWPGFTRQKTQLILTNANSYFMDFIRGVSLPTIAISVKCLLQLNLGELRFAMRLIAETFKHYPIENIHTHYNKPSMGELIGYLKEDLEYGISYCRKLIAVTTNRIKQNKLNQTENYALEQNVEFYTDMIREIELKLAEKNKNALSNDSEVKHDIPNYDMPLGVFLEILSIKHEWQEDSKQVPHIFDSSILLEDLTKILPSLRIKDMSEYKHATLESIQFLHKLRILVLDKNDILMRAKLVRLIDIALENKVACFSELYIIIAHKLMYIPADRSYRYLPPLGIFKQLYKLLQDFCRAETRQIAVEKAQQIYDFLRRKNLSSLFVNVKNILRRVSRKDPIDEVIWSNIGRLIHWENYITCYKEDDYWREQFLNWASLDDTGIIAKVLVQLGMLNEARLWPKLSTQFVKKIYDSDGDIIIGAIPCTYTDPEKNNYRSDFRPTWAFLRDYFVNRHRWKIDLPSMEYSI